jgi:heme/copper-type cytochrome/quinol oxidase subunit 2
MTPRRTALLVAVAVGALAGVGFPFVELWRDCRLPQSEACVWGRALLRLTLAVGVVVGTVVGVVAYVLVRAWQRRADRHRGA